MLDEVDIFIINCYIEGRPCNEIARSFKNNGMDTINERLKKYKELGIKISQGMKVQKLNSFDIKVFNLIRKGIPIKKIADYTGKDRRAVSHSRRKLALILPEGIQELDDDTQINEPLDESPIQLENNSKIQGLEEKILNFLVKGYSMKYAADQLNIDYYYVRQIAKQVKQKKEYFLAVDKVKKEIGKLRSEGKTQKEIAELLKMSKRKVAKYLQEMLESGIDIPKRTVGSESQQLNKKIRKLITVKSQAKIAKELGISRQAVSSRLNRNQIIQATKNIIGDKKPTYEQFIRFSNYILEYYNVDTRDLSELVKKVHDYTVDER